MSADILCLGEPLVEFTRQSDGAYLQGFGGDTSNAAIAAARQGARVGYVSAVGTDRFGDALIELWQGEEIGTEFVLRNPDAPTGIYFVDPDPVERHFTYYRDGSAASRMRPDELPINALRNARILHLSGITLAVSEDLRETAFAAIEQSAAAAVQISIDTNLRLKLWQIGTARSVLETALAKASIAVTSVDDCGLLFGLDDPTAIAERLHAIGPETVLVTRGSDGAWLSRSGQGFQITPAPAEPVDSTGAGDSFAGAFLAWYLELGDALEAARRAAIVAAGTVSGLGAITPIPRRDEVLTTRSDQLADGNRR